MRAIVVGGSGSLGRVLVAHLLAFQGVELVVNVGRHINQEAHRNVLIPADRLNQDSTAKHIIDELRSSGPFSAIFCVSGGWCGGNLANDKIISDSASMLESSLLTGLLSCNIATDLLKDAPLPPLIVLCGSIAATKPQPGMIAYGVAKAGLHYLANTVASDPVSAGLPIGTRIHCIIPGTLNTPDNRNAMPGADHSQWTDLDSLSEQMINWMADPSSTNGLDVLVKV